MTYHEQIVHARRDRLAWLPLCRARSYPGRHQFISITLPAISCEACLYILDVQGRAADLKAAVCYGTAAAFGIRRQGYRGAPSEEDVREVASCAAHFAHRLLEEAAA